MEAFTCSACAAKRHVPLPYPVCYAGIVALDVFGGGLSRIVGRILVKRLRPANQIRQRRRTLREFLEHSSLNVAYCDWGTSVLIEYGARPQTVIHSPLGMPQDFVQAMRNGAGARTQPDGRLFVIGFVGRLVSLKGVHILVEAFRKTSYENARLRIRGISAGGPDEYVRKLQRLAGDDSRVEFLPALPLGEIIEEYRRLDMLAVPSLYMETGPLVVLEGLAVGTPVYASTNMGQVKLMEEMGTVVHPNTPEAWRRVFDDAFAAHREGRWPGIRQAVLARRKPIRQMQDVAEEMGELYKSLLRSR
jgi:glycosyltransferase involved in cell wall biosynthesis